MLDDCHLYRRTDLIGIITLLRQGSVHIEPGSQLYEGGNVMICSLVLCLAHIGTSVDLARSKGLSHTGLLGEGQGFLLKS